MAIPNWSHADRYFEAEPGAAPAGGCDADGVPWSLRASNPGELVWNASGNVYVHAYAYDLGQAVQTQTFDGHGAHRLADLEALFAFRRPWGTLTLHDCIFLDCETTGLGRAALPFMVGVARYERLPSLPTRPPHAGGAQPVLPSVLAEASASGDEPPTHFVVRQLFVLQPRDESALLQEVQALLAGEAVCVSFNGDRFDLPLLRARFQANRYHFPELPLTDPFAAARLPSLDILPLARRLWRQRIGSCALSNCERRILGWARTHADVAGAQIPGLYARFLQTGQADGIHRVFYHNRHDIVSMAFLLARLVKGARQAAQSDLPALSGEEALAAGKILLRSAQTQQAERLLAFAMKALQGQTLQSEAYFLLARHCKRQARWPQAVAIWERWISSVAAVSVVPYVELAKYHEWRSQDLGQAEAYARWALHVYAALPVRQQSRALQLALQHRVNRIERKRAGRSRASPPASGRTRTP